MYIYNYTSRFLTMGMQAKNQEIPNKMDVLSINLTNLLKKNKINENNLAKQLNIPYNTIHRIITGTTSDPRLSTLSQIASYFNVSIDELITNNIYSSSLESSATQGKTPLLSWHMLKTVNFQKKINLFPQLKWISTPPMEGVEKDNNVFALEATKSMQSRFPLGTTFIINYDEKPVDGDIILVKFNASNSASLRELVTDPPRWQLLPIIPGSESIYFNENEHLIIGVVILTLIKTRHS